MKSLGLVVFWIAIASCLFAQKQITVKADSNNEKSVSVDVNVSDDGTRTVKISTDGDGAEKIYEWTDRGEIPEEVKKQLEEDNIDITILEEHKGEHKNIWITADDDIDRGERVVRKKMIIVKEDDDGRIIDLNWDGEGEIPIEMQDLLDEHDIDLKELHEDHGDVKSLKKRKRLHKEKRKKMRVKARQNGRRMNTKEKRKYKIIKSDEDGSTKIFEWSNDDSPEELGEDEDIRVFGLRERKSHGKGGRKNIFLSEDNDIFLSEAYMGAQVESDDNGARIIDVMKDSPADKAGLQKDDVVQRINGARSRSMDDLLNILNYFDPQDRVEITIIRDGKEKKLNLTLGERPETYR